MVLYPRSEFGGKIIFMLGLIKFNQELIDIRFLQEVSSSSESYSSFNPGENDDEDNGANNMAKRTDWGDKYPARFSFQILSVIIFIVVVFSENT